MGEACQYWPEQPEGLRGWLVSQGGFAQMPNGGGYPAKSNYQRTTVSGHPTIEKRASPLVGCPLTVVR